jgi:hypothetical protein
LNGCCPRPSSAIWEYPAKTPRREGGRCSNGSPLPFWEQTANTRR